LCGLLTFFTQVYENSLYYNLYSLIGLMRSLLVIFNFHYFSRNVYTVKSISFNRYFGLNSYFGKIVVRTPYYYLLYSIMQTRYLYLLRFILPVIDLLMLNAVYALAYYIANKAGNSGLLELQVHYIIVCNLLWLLNAFIFGLYTEYGARRIERIYRATWRTTVLHSILFTFYLFFVKNTDFSRTFLVLFYSILSISCIINRFLGTLFQYILVKKFNATRGIAIMGNNYTAARLKAYLKKQNNVDFYGFIGNKDSLYPDEAGRLPESTIRDLINAVAAGVKDLYVCIPPDRMGDTIALVKEADKQLLRLKFVPDLGGVMAAQYSISYLGNEFPIITLRNEPLEDLSSRFKKRSFDVIFSLLVIIFILSWLYPLIAILIKLQSNGPVLFKQERSGRNDHPFLCYKFRSMRVNSSSNSKQATKDDDRITKIGKFLRKTSLDEMPQFFNVFMGDMSVVGPRPHMLKHTEEYRKLIDKFMVRHFSKPGITGWAQVNGLRGETKETEDMERRVEHDIYYVENWSLMWDVKIIFLTIINVARGEANAF
jgi:putative colanic acid biosynthesis UDP-glucose lipid carrier transferase